MTKLGAAALYNTGPLKFTAGYRYNKESSRTAARCCVTTTGGQA
jgi:hypothetical protein